jgi:hypothetical protein
MLSASSFMTSLSIADAARGAMQTAVAAKQRTSNFLLITFFIGYSPIFIKRW